MPPLLIQALFVLVLAGLALWALSEFPIDAQIAKIIRVVVIVFVALWAIRAIAQMFGVALP